MRARRVAEAMISRPKTMPADATLGQARAALADGHVHLLLLVRDGELLGTLDRADLDSLPADGPALPWATLTGRTTGPEADVDRLRAELAGSGRRRLAVVDPEGRLLGLLCLKRTGEGFCSDAGVEARRHDRAGDA